MVSPVNDILKLYGTNLPNIEISNFVNIDISIFININIPTFINIVFICRTV